MVGNHGGCLYRRILMMKLGSMQTKIRLEVNSSRSLRCWREGSMRSRTGSPRPRDSPRMKCPGLLIHTIAAYSFIAYLSHFLTS